MSGEFYKGKYPEPSEFRSHLRFLTENDAIGTEFSVFPKPDCLAV